MPSNTSASMFGGAGGRGSRASVASLAGLKNVLRNDTERDSAPATRAAPPPPDAAAPAAPPAQPADDKQTLRGLNGRLSGYLDRVRQLQEGNCDTQKEIDDILAKRKTPERRDWDKVQEPLDELKEKIKDITLDNAKLLLQIDNTKLANDDFQNKLDDETKARKDLEKDLDSLKKVMEETKMNQDQMQTEIKLVKSELERLEKEHKDEVDALREKIKDSEVKVDIESQNSNLAEIIKDIRAQYDKVAQKNLKETDDWYKSEFDNIKVEEVKNVETLQSSKSEFNELIKQKKIVEINIQTELNVIRSLEETVNTTKTESNRRLAPLNHRILQLEAELKEVRSQVEQQGETNNDLLCVKMKLEQEINSYHQLIQGITADPERSAKA
ncbi:keratin, type I cytoskeletal 18-like isoform X2 [Cololabis saira]|uniref:keratin, type I cytoskeletal 18-like isoform X2 n=1 Tax=Cololabis saira TaxID=129043 RepID=UPI002AD3968D|nr:keratin, type I cytoskeletal 18-like isoform X2 [Cololabis saira]